MPATKAPAYLLEFNTRTRLQKKKIALAAENRIFSRQFAAFEGYQHHETLRETHHLTCCDQSEGRVRC
jgi:hypothetical protein